jgi:hypothetical protein
MDNLSKIIKVPNGLRPTTTATVSATASTTPFVSNSTLMEAEDPFFKIEPLVLQPIKKAVRKEAR